jgi:hypothetical protein
MKLLRMTPGKGDVLLAEGDPDVAEDEERLIEEFRRQLELGMWAAVPSASGAGRHEATMVRDFAEVPAGSERVIFFPQAAGGSATAEVRARDLLRSVVGDELADMYEALGFLATEEDDDFGFLVYPQRPIVSYDSRTGELLSEHCVRFPDEELPDADDVLAKWMSLTADPTRFLGIAALDRIGRQHDPEMLRRDLAALMAWRQRV